MRTVLSTTAWRRTLMVTLTVAVAGAVSLPMANAAAPSTSDKRSGHASVAQGSAVKASDASTGVAAVGSAVKYVRDADGTVRRVR